MELIEIIGEKVIFRSIRIEDVTDEYVSWLNDKEVAGFLATVNCLYTKSMLHEYVSNIIMDNRHRMFMVIDKISGASIGTAKISNIDNVNGICNIGLMIGNRNFWGAGIGKESLSLLIDYAFKDLNIRKISDAIQSNNSRSLAANLKLGFSVEGVLKQQIWHEGEQKYLDKILIGLFAKDWKGK